MSDAALDFGFFHSFPRFSFTDPEEEITRGLQVLESMFEIGLLVTPELLYFPMAEQDGELQSAGTYVFQRRSCFTYLRRNEILKHSSVFGAYAIEFSINGLREAGAFPVIYFPQPTKFGGFGGFDEFATNLIHQIGDAVTLLKETQDTFEKISEAKADKNRVASGRWFVKDQEVELNTADYILRHLIGVKGNLSEVALYLEAMTNLFYHTDSARPWCYSRGPDLAYYQQMEWRISSGLRLQGTTVDRRLGQTEVEKLIQIPFFRKMSWIKTEKESLEPNSRDRYSLLMESPSGTSSKQFGFRISFQVKLPSDLLNMD
jgi:hypothetical protein